MNNKNDLTKGHIFTSILLLALPIMGTSFVQMAYNLIDMIWIGRLGSASTAAVGTAGFYLWLSAGIIFLCKIGAEVLVAQYIGKKDLKSAKAVVQNVIQMIIVLGITFAGIILLFNKEMIGFFNIRETEVVDMAILYLSIIAFGLVFYFINPVLTAIFNGYGKSGAPFAINTVGLVFNIIFDPLLIFGIGPFPALGVKGAAIATILAQFIVTVVFVVYIKLQKEVHLFEGFKLFKKPNYDVLKRIVNIGFPVGLQSILFTFFAMIIARIIADWGAVAIAVQKVGSQIESISWMTASGFSTATSTFVGQNYGAKKFDRIKKGVIISIVTMGTFGVGTSLLLIIFADSIFRIFIQEADAVIEGIIYLRILGISQFFMCIEIVTNGAFNGLGKTTTPAINSSIFNGLRIPGALILSATALSLSGVWWSITISSIFKGLVIVTMFVYYFSKFKKHQESEYNLGIELL